MDGWLLIPHRFYILTHTHSCTTHTHAHTGSPNLPQPQTGVWECFMFDSQDDLFISPGVPTCFLCWTTWLLSKHKQLVEWLRGRKNNRDSGFIHFQTEVGPHVQLNQVRLSKNFLPAEMTQDCRAKNLQMATKGGFTYYSEFPSCF